MSARNSNIRPIIKETSDMRDLDLTGSGAVEIEPGDSATLVEYEPQGGSAYLLGLGATDHDDTDYELRFDHERHGITRSPLGLVNNPFSFYQQLGVVPPFADLVEYRVSVDADADEALTFAGRIFVTENDPRGGER